MKLTYIALTILTTSLVGCGVEDSSFNRATMLNKHGLTSEAKSELIDVTFKSNSNEEKAKAMYMLGSIAFEENHHWLGILWELLIGVALIQSLISIQSSTSKTK